MGPRAQVHEPLEVSRPVHFWNWEQCPVVGMSRLPVQRGDSCLALFQQPWLEVEVLVSSLQVYLVLVFACGSLGQDCPPSRTAWASEGIVGIWGWISPCCAAGPHTAERFVACMDCTHWMLVPTYCTSCDNQTVSRWLSEAEGKVGTNIPRGSEPLLCALNWYKCKVEIFF